MVEASARRERWRVRRALACAAPTKSSSYCPIVSKLHAFSDRIQIACIFCRLVSELHDFLSKLHVFSMKVLSLLTGPNSARWSRAFACAAPSSSSSYCRIVFHVNIQITCIFNELSNCDRTHFVRVCTRTIKPPGETWHTVNLLVLSACVGGGEATVTGKLVKPRNCSGRPHGCRKS